MAELRVIIGGGKPWRPSLETDAVWHARFAASDRTDASLDRIVARFDRITASFDRIEALLLAILDHLDGIRPLKGRPMSAERNAHIRAITHEAAHRQRWSEAEPEPEPALPDVPLHQRGFGVMDEPGP